MTTGIDTARPVETTDARWERRGLALWTGVVLVALVWGTARIAGTDQHLHAAPLAGRWRGELDIRILPAVAFAALVVTSGARVTRTMAWRPFVTLSGAAATAWAGVLAVRDGWATPFDRPSDYWRLATTLDSPLSFLRTFTDQLVGYPIHVRGHPPAATLTFWTIDEVGLHGTRGAALVVIAAWGVTVAAVLVALRHLAGQEVARRTAPFVVLSPAAVWAGFSADAMFAGVIAVGITLTIVATGAQGTRGTVIAVAGGAALGLALHLTYGAVPLLVVPAAVVVVRRRFDVLLPAAAGAAAVTALFVVAGFWWFEGLAQTHEQYWAGVAGRRPWTYYVLAANPAALGLATGPVLAVGLARLRRADVSLWLLPAAALVAVALANVSGLSKGEVERIWLPYFPWILAAAATVPTRHARSWLAAQALLGLGLQTFLRSTW